MPPADSDQSRLSAQQIETLRQWITQGAQWGEHWSFVAPKRPGLPTNGDHQWVRNALDTFILHRLEDEGIKPSPQAAPQVLLRRATLALTGLPPTPMEVELFLADDSPAAYERAVDGCLVHRDTASTCRWHGWMHADMPICSATRPIGNALCGRGVTG